MTPEELRNLIAKLRNKENKTPEEIEILDFFDKLLIEQEPPKRELMRKGFIDPNLPVVKFYIGPESGSSSSKPSGKCKTCGQKLPK